MLFISRYQNNQLKCVDHLKEGRTLQIICVDESFGWKNNIAL